VHDAYGVALAGAGQHDEAIKHFVMAINLRRDYDSAWLHLAPSLEAVGRANEAIRLYATLVHESRSTALAQQRLAALMARLNSAEAWYQLADAEFKANRPKDAVGALRRAVELKPDWYKAQFDLGVALAQSGDLAGAEAAFEKALSLQPESEEAKRSAELARKLRVSQGATTSPGDSRAR
jgi:Flp pilus assembly protein TadD